MSTTWRNEFRAPESVRSIARRAFSLPVFLYRSIGRFAHTHGESFWLVKSLVEFHIHAANLESNHGAERRRVRRESPVAAMHVLAISNRCLHGRRAFTGGTREILTRMGDARLPVMA